MVKRYRLQARRVVGKSARMRRKPSARPGRRPGQAPPSPAMRVVPIRLPESLLERARKIADADRRSLSAWIRLVVEKAIEGAEG